MKQIIPRKISIQNFLSIGEDPVVEEFRPGINMIVGVNLDKEDSRNGVGKSTIADAIFYALFGSLIRDIKVDDIVNKITRKNCLVTLWFSVIENGKETKYELTRGIKPSKIKLLEDGESKTHTKPETTKRVIEIIGTTPEMVKNTSIMNISETLPFLAQKGVARKKFIEEVFDLEIFREMLKIIREDVSNLQKDIDIDQSKQETLKRQLQVQIDQRDKYMERQREGVDRLAQKIVEHEKRITELEDQIVEVDEQEKERLRKENRQIDDTKGVVEAEIRRLTTHIAEGNSRISRNNREIQSFESLGDVCVKCKRPWSGADLADREKEIQRLKLDNESVLNGVEADKTTVKQIEEKAALVAAHRDLNSNKIHNIDLLIEKNRHTKQEIDQQRKEIDVAHKEIEKIKSEADLFEAEIGRITVEMQTTEKKLDDMDEKMKTLQAAKYVVSEEGIKSFIVGKMLKMLNSRLNYYLDRMHSNCRWKFDEFFEEKITNEQGQSCSYHNFSDGERTRIDLAMLFTFRDIRRKQSSVDINFSMYDELLDCSLDGAGIRDVLEILKEGVKANDEIIYIISHRDDASKCADGSVIHLVKKDGITRKIDDAKV